jgi:ferredoxin
MPKIQFDGQEIECEENENLRRVLLRAGAPLYNGAAKTFHCRGIGTCGTCAIEIEGQVSNITDIERWRLGFPPHQRGAGLRLACQCKVRSDLSIKKHPGFWGQNISR